VLEDDTARPEGPRLDGPRRDGVLAEGAASLLPTS